VTEQRQPPVSATDAERLTPLTRTDKLSLVVEILGAYTVVRWRMRRADIQTVVGQLRGNVNNRRSDYPLARQLARAVARTLTFLPTDNRCLVRSLVLDKLLARRSLQSIVVIAARAEPDFGGHAWVEHDGVALLPPGSADYQRFAEL